MIILGIDTSSAVCGLALSEAILDEIKPIAQIGLNIPNAHSEKIMLLLEDLLRNAGVDKKSIGAIAVSIGPGSFTGLRIGLSTAKGLAYGLDIPIVSTPTLDVIAEKVKFLENPLVVATTSRKNEFYCCSYEQGQRTSDYLVLTEEELFHKVVPDTVLICDAAERIIGKMPENLRKSVLIMDKSFSYPDAFYVTTMGYRKIISRQTDSLSELVPMYVQGFRGSKAG